MAISPINHKQMESEVDYGTHFESQSYDLLINFSAIRAIDTGITYKQNDIWTQITIRQALSSHSCAGNVPCEREAIDCCVPGA